MEAIPLIRIYPNLRIIANARCMLKTEISVKEVDSEETVGFFVNWHNTGSAMY